MNFSQCVSIPHVHTHTHIHTPPLYIHTHTLLFLNTLNYIFATSVHFSLLSCLCCAMCTCGSTVVCVQESIIMWDRILVLLWWLFQRGECVRECNMWIQKIHMRSVCGMAFTIFFVHICVITVVILFIRINNFILMHSDQEEFVTITILKCYLFLYTM